MALLILRDLFSNKSVHFLCVTAGMAQSTMCVQVIHVL